MDAGPRNFDTETLKPKPNPGLQCSWRISHGLRLVLTEAAPVRNRLDQLLVSRLVLALEFA